MKKNIWDILFWIMLLILAGYIIGKLTRIISTPEWVDLIPLITIFFSAGILYQKLMFLTITTHRRTDYLKNNLNKLTNSVKEIEKVVYHIDKQQNLFLDLLKSKNKR